MPYTPEALSHWEQGHKYALEGMKVLLLLNGGAAIALMAFLGQLETEDRQSAMHSGGSCSLIAFGLGALLAAVIFALAYFTQLQYGNRADGDAKADRRAWYSHHATYIVFLLSVITFVFGLWFARSAIASG
jgi:hypothetical protein